LIDGAELLPTYGDRPETERAIAMTNLTVTKLTFLSIIGAIYVAAGLSLLFYIGIVRVSRWRLPLPILRMRWDRHGLIDIIIGSTYAISDQLIRLDMMSH
jgi:hypothetical protein